MSDSMHHGPTSTGGDLLFLQWLRIRQAKRYSKPRQAIRCWRGKHNPPHNGLFEEWGAVIVGGPCRRRQCSDETYREVAWIGNVWDFEGATTVTTSPGNSRTTVNPSALEGQATKHIDWLNSASFFELLITRRKPS